MKKVALYVRVSTEKQAVYGHSITAQLTNLKNRCKLKGYHIHDIYIDEGVSAKSLHRPAFKKLLSDAKHDMFDIILFQSLDRLTRSLKDLYTILEVCEDLNVFLESANDEFDTKSAMGRTYLYILGIFAQTEREMISERTKRGFQGAIQKKRYPLGNPPYGFILIKGTGKLEVLPKEIDRVKIIFNLYVVDRLTALDIERYLTFKYKEKWRHQRILEILQNKLYIGTLVFSGKEYPNFIPPVIDIKTFEKAQYILNKSQRKKLNEYYFDKLLICHTCKSIMKNDSTKKTNRNGEIQRYIYYKCPQCKFRLNQQKVFRKIILHKTIRNKLKTHISSSENFKKKQYIHDALLNQEQKLQQKKDKLSQLFLDNIIPNDVYIEKNKKIALEQEALKLQVTKSKENLAFLSEKHLSPSILRSIIIKNYRIEVRIGKNHFNDFEIFIIKKT